MLLSFTCDIKPFFKNVCWSTGTTAVVGAVLFLVINVVTIQKVLATIVGETRQIHASNEIITLL
jgi:hypothetical protein